MVQQFESEAEAVEFFTKKYPHIPKILIEACIEYDQMEQRKIMSDLKKISSNDDSIRSNKIKQRLQKRLLENKSLIVEQQDNKVVVLN